MTSQPPAPASAGRHDHPHTDQEDTMTDSSKKAPSLPPRWFIRSFWVVQRAVYSVTGGRFGLRTATADHEGYMRLRTVGRRSGEERIAILAYFEDGPDVITMAMNGWADAEPAWWLNLQAQPDVTVDLPGGSRAVRGRAAGPDERPRLWARWAAFGKDQDLDGFAARRSRETAVVILSPRPESGS
jgi:deazaflavin-dependent oxidoreductase (nitroreductase family)